jgi:hypothetical protein
MAKYKLNRFEKNEHPQWDEFVSRCPTGTIFHTTKWLEMVADRIEVLGIFNGEGKLVGGIALPEITQGIILRSYIPALTTYVGPIVDLPEVLEPLKKYSKEQDLYKLLLSEFSLKKSYDFTIPAENSNIYPFISAGFSISVSFPQRITCDLDEYHKNISRSNHRDINKLTELIKSGELNLTQVKTIDEVLPYLHPIFAVKMDLIRKVFSKDKLNEYWMGYSIKDLSGKILSTVVMVFDKRNGYALLTGGVSNLEGILSHTKLMCLDALITFCITSGRSFDFGGSSIPRIAQYNFHLGGIPTPTYRVSRYSSVAYSLIKDVRDIFTRRGRQGDFYSRN